MKASSGESEPLSPKTATPSSPPQQSPAEKRDEQKAKFCEEKYCSLFLNAADIIAVIDRDANLIEINPKVQAELGISREELIGQNLTTHRMLTRESADRIRFHLREIVEGRNQAVFEINARRIDGTLVPFEVNAVPIREADVVKAVQANLRNIRDRHEKEQALRNSEETTRVLLNAASNAAFLIDSGGIVLAANEQALNRMEKTAAELVGKPLASFLPPELGEARRQRGLEVLRTGRPLSFEDEWDGRAYSSSIHPIHDEKGRVIKLAIYSKDITEEKESEEERKKLTKQLQQAQKMEAIGTLAGGIAHDFNNLLMGIQGNISLLLLDKTPDHRDATYLKNMEKSVMRASELTRQILGFARGGKYEVKVTDINALLEKTAEMFGRTRREITIRRDLQDSPWKIEADQSQLQQVLLNLLVNAWQAMPGGGELALQTANVVIEAGSPGMPPDAVPGSYVRIDVTDTGVGMDTHTQARIFEPFFTTREPGHGTGLGLSSVFGIVTNHNGFITVRSEKGRGSTFSVFFPAISGAVTQKQKPAGAARRDANTILLVEDEEMVANIGRQMLERLGYRVIVAQTGDEALALYEKRRAEIDLVILDMIMPGMGGGTVFDRIRAIDPQAAVLLSSGYSLNGQALEIMKRGCRGFIQKPFSIEQLKQKISEILPSPQDQPG